MPGIAGYLSHKPDLRMDEKISKMLGHLSCDYTPTIKVSSMLDGRLGLGIATSETLPLQRMGICSSSGDSCFIVDGEFYSYSGRMIDEQRQAEISRSIGDCSSTDEIIRIIQEIDGIFSIAVYLKKANCIIIITDALGLKPLYYYQNQSIFTFSSECKAILPVLPMIPDPDFETISDLFRFGYPLGNGTLVSDVHRLPPGALAVVDIGTGRVDIREYWSAASLFVERNGFDRTIGKQDLVETFANAVAGRLSQPSRICVGISGGLDSRAIAAALGDAAGEMTSCTLGFPGGIEASVGAEIAALAGLKNQVLTVDMENVGDPGESVKLDIIPSDGMRPPSEWDTRTYHEFHQQSGADILMVGLGAEIAKVDMVSPVRATKEFLSLQSRSEMINYINAKVYQLGLTDHQIRAVFSADFADRLLSNSTDRVANIMRHCPTEIHNIDVMCYWYLAAYLSRHAVYGLSVRRPSNELRFPYADRLFLAQLLRCNPEWRTRAVVQIETVRRLSPKMMHVRNANDGIPLSAGKTEIIIKKVLQRLESKATSLIRRNSKQSSFATHPVVRQYFVETLCSEECLSRPMYCPDGLRKVAESTVNGDSTYRWAVNTIVGLECWNKSFMDNIT